MAKTPEQIADEMLYYLEHVAYGLPNAEVMLRIADYMKKYALALGAKK